MLYGVREICDVVLRAKKYMTIGEYEFYRDMPVFYFDSLKTSSLEGQATTVYAQGGKGNARLVAWEGERTVTFTMEDALISPVTFSMLTGAKVIKYDDPGDDKADAFIHCSESTEIKIDDDGEISFPLSKNPAESWEDNSVTSYIIPLDPNTGDICNAPIRVIIHKGTNDVITVTDGQEEVTKAGIKNGYPILVDYYTTDNISGYKQITIDAENFAGNYYLEASTLWRDKQGTDHAAEFIVPNCKIQSNFTFTMAASGDPSTFTFTMDAFPDYLKFDKKRKVIAAIQVYDEAKTENTGAGATTIEAAGNEHVYYTPDSSSSSDDSNP